MGAALSEDDVAGHNELSIALFGTKALAGTLFGAVGNTLGGVRSMSDLWESEEGGSTVGEREAAEGGEKRRRGRHGESTCPLKGGQCRCNGGTN